MSAKICNLRMANNHIKKQINKIFWLIWSVCLLGSIVLSTTNHGRGEAGGRLMLFSQLFLIAATALCTFYRTRTALKNLIVAVVLNALLFFCLFGSNGEGYSLLLLFLIVFINLGYGTGLLVYLLIMKSGSNS